jgi:hypothetical protein
MAENDAAETNEQRFERLGIDRMRILVATSNLPSGMLTEASIWVAQRDKEDRLRNEDSQSLQMRTALSAKYAAWIAAIAAIIAAIAAIISVVEASK